MLRRFTLAKKRNRMHLRCMNNANIKQLLGPQDWQGSSLSDLRHGTPWPSARREPRHLPAIGASMRTGIFFSEAGELFDRQHVLPESFLSPRHHERDIQRFEKKRLKTIAEAVPAGGGQVWITDRLSHNYYHWICDALPRLEAWLNVHESAQLMLPYRVLAQPYVPDSLAAFANVTVHKPPPTKAGYLETLWITEKVAGEGMHHPVLAPRLAERVRRAFASDVKPDGRRLYVSRSGSRFRRLANEADLARQLELNGYETVQLEKMPFVQQVRLLASATHLCGPHGAGLSNIAFMAPGARLLELRRPVGTPNCFAELADVCGHEYRMLACQPEHRDAHHHTGDIVVDPAALANALGDMNQ